MLSLSNRKVILKYLVRFSVLFAVFFGLIIISSAAFAQESEKPSIFHKELTENDLPSPGAEMKLGVTLLNTHDSQLTVKGYVSRDGKLMELNLSDYSADTRDRLQYSTIINAPLADMNYQFLLMNGNTVVATSKKFHVRRSCLPHVAPIDTKIDPKTPQNQKVKLLQSQVYGLQDEVQNYENAVKLIDELRILTEK